LPPRGRDNQLRHQQRQLFYGASIFTLVVVVLADLAPAVAGWLAAWLLASLALAGAYIAVWELGHWWTRRRARRFEEHTAQALRVVR
jgi:uncharacterized membrane protein